MEVLAEIDPLELDCHRLAYPAPVVTKPATKLPPNRVDERIVAQRRIAVHAGLVPDDMRPLRGGDVLWWPWRSAFGLIVLVRCLPQWLYLCDEETQSPCFVRADLVHGIQDKTPDCLVGPREVEEVTRKEAVANLRPCQPSLCKNGRYAPRRASPAEDH
ncbi:hypothetical protein MKEN_01053300 [Mycena kentingensis (nom. inval.)]|nr:hypothetical protein MKEN_01053300 [Mycena kentingensis (nom. inval.)]